MTSDMNDGAASGDGQLWPTAAALYRAGLACCREHLAGAPPGSDVLGLAGFHHSTVPFPVAETRISIAFDALPIADA